MLNEDRPETVHDVAVPEHEVVDQVAYPGPVAYCTEYPVTGELPLLAGGVHERTRLVLLLPAVAPTPDGAPGAPGAALVVAAAALLLLLVPTPLVATTVIE